MSVNVISNFNINTNEPIDSRIVASSSVVRNSIQWTYEGLKVYQIDNQKNYIWRGGTWSIEGGSGNGIYGGSGSLVGDTYINTGTVSGGGTSSNSKSNILYYLATSGVSNNNLVRFANIFNRSLSGSDWKTIEVKSQYSYNAGYGWVDGPYISFNPYQASGTVSADIAFGSGNTELMRISSDGNVSIGVNNANGYKLLVAGSASFNSVVAGAASFNSVVAGAASFNSVVAGAASFNSLKSVDIYSSNDITSNNNIYSNNGVQSYYFGVYNPLGNYPFGTPNYNNFAWLDTNGDPTTGLYSVDGTDIGLSIGGQDVIHFYADNLSHPNPGTYCVIGNRSGNIDIVTNGDSFDKVGWTSHILSNSELGLFLYSVNADAYSFDFSPTIQNDWHLSGSKVILYKKIGKTVFVSFNVTNSTIALSLNSLSVYGSDATPVELYIKLPSSIKPSTNYKNFYGKGLFESPIFSSVRTTFGIVLGSNSDISVGAPSGYYLIITPDSIGSFNTLGYLNLRGMITYEIN
jgi:hypothetical protein